MKPTLTVNSLGTTCVGILHKNSIFSTIAATTPLPSPQHIHSLIKHLWCISFIPNSMLKILRIPQWTGSQRAYSLEEGGEWSLYFGTRELQEWQARERLKEGPGLVLLGWDILTIVAGKHSHPVVPTCWEPRTRGNPWKQRRYSEFITTLNFYDLYGDYVILTLWILKCPFPFKKTGKVILKCPYIKTKTWHAYVGFPLIFKNSSLKHSIGCQGLHTRLCLGEGCNPGVARFVRPPFKPLWHSSSHQMRTSLIVLDRNGGLMGIMGVFKCP